MKKLLLAIGMLVALPAGMWGYAYEHVAGDPMKARIYTLSNGLKIYLAQNADEPRVEAYIVVRAGAKNDPSESTGLAHYLEHLMFKGTSSFGTQDYARERPLLDSIRSAYEVYGRTTDEAERKAIYHRIDSLSYAASRYAIANEYDKLMAGIGSRGSNAYTSTDATCYLENIPANEVDRWARVQADRFQDMVIRGFHTELEAVYEEYNISLTRDMDKVFQTVHAILYPHHPYGLQTILGTQEHLKNPSLENVRSYYREWYVPNNVAVCLSGDIQNPDSIVGIIDRHFGAWRPNPALPTLSFSAELPLAQPVTREVMGRERDMAVLGWRFPGTKSRESDLLEVLSRILYNNRAGLFDLNLNQSQQVMAAQGYVYAMSDYSTLYAFVLPKEGQTLEQARDLVLKEVRKVCEGDFSEALLQAIVNNLKRDRMSLTESNERMADLFVQSFINGTPWQDQVEQMERFSRITKQDVVDFARRYLTGGYACVMKRMGEDPNEKKIEKPQINPIEMNRDKQSRFVQELLADEAHEVEPVFVDFGCALQTDTFKNGNELLYKRNEGNGLFQLTYYIDRGSKADPALDVAAQYIEYLGTRKRSAEALQTELYRLACDVDFRVDPDRTTIRLRGLSEHMPAAMKLAEEWIYQAVPQEEVYADLVSDLLKERQDAKLEQVENFNRLVAYGVYGADNRYTRQLSAEQLQQIRPADLLNALHDLRNVRQTIAYYGPMELEEVKRLVGKIHRTSAKPQPMAADNEFVAREVTEDEVLLAPYEAKNIYMRQYSNNGEHYDVALLPEVTLFNEYFGGGMNTVVFQELRESRGLAYSASALYTMPRKQGQTTGFYTNIITQNDKMADCLNVFHDITEQLPLSETSFTLAKTAIRKRLATERIIRGQVLAYWLRCRDLGLSEDPNRAIYQRVGEMTPEDLARFHRKHVKGRKYRTLVLGDEKELDMETLQTQGTIRRVTTEEIFGY